MPFYNYHINGKDHQIEVSEGTEKLTPGSFLGNGKLWEEKALKVFLNLIKDQEVNIADVGAQSGLYSLYAKYLPKATFYSFEPYKPTLQLLKDNIKLNNITNIKTYNLAISDKKGEAIININKTHNGLHTLGNNIKKEEKIVYCQETVKTDTLDNIFYNNDIPLNFIKADVEGHEYFVLKGGEKSIRKYRPIIQIEWEINHLSQCNVKPEELTKLIEDLGYKEHHRTREELLLFPKEKK